MDEKQLRRLIGRVKDGKLSRRAFVGRMLALGITAPLASEMLAFCGAARAQEKEKVPYKPTKRGGGGALKVLWWQGATLLNPHFAVGTKDQDGSRIFYEPLAGWDADGNLFPVLAAEIPSRENGGLSADGMSVTWKLKRDVTWHDGKPFTADDCVFNWEYARDPAVAATTIGSYQDVQGREGRQPHDQGDVREADAVLGRRLRRHPRHDHPEAPVRRLHAAPSRATRRPTSSRSAPGPYKFVDFKPGDMVRGEINTNYHDAEPAAFRHDRDEGRRRRGLGGARRDPDRRVRLRLEHAGRGRDPAAPREGRQGHAPSSPRAATSSTSSSTSTDPWTEVDGERASLKTKHPLLSRPGGAPGDRRCWSTASRCRTTSTAAPASRPANFLNNPERFRSKNTKWEFNIDKANQILDAAGWKRGADGIREKDGKKLKFVYQTSINAPRQKTQAIVKQACQKAGIDLELKSVTASVFFSSDVANPDTYTKFWCDIQMYTTTMTQPDPERVHEPVHVLGGRDQGEQVAGPQHHALAERRVRQGLPRGARRARPGQARGAVHQA